MTLLDEPTTRHRGDDTHAVPARRLGTRRAVLKKGDTQCACDRPATVSGGDGDGEVQHFEDAQRPYDFSDAVAVIMAHAKRRLFAIKMQVAIDNALRAYVARQLLAVDPELKARRDKCEPGDFSFLKPAYQAAARLIDGDLSKLANHDAGVSESVAPLIDATNKSRLAWDSIRDESEAEMVKAAKALPVYAWVESVKGLGALGLAMLVGEAGSLADYANPGKLWKRMGLAPKSCYRMTCKDGSEANAIPRARRSLSWQVADSLLKADNPYRAMYRERCEYEAKQHPEFDKGTYTDAGKRQLTKHGDNRAKRYAEKRMLRDLWRAWRDAK